MSLHLIDGLAGSTKIAASVFRYFLFIDISGSLNPGIVGSLNSQCSIKL